MRVIVFSPEAREHVRMLPRFALSLGIILAMLAIGGADADAANSCPGADQATERRKLERLLSTNDVSKNERAFLLAGAAARLKEVQARNLNARGRACGIDNIRAHILACMNSTLPPLLGDVPADRKATSGFWGRKKLSARAAGFIAMFHACRAGTMKTFLSG
jgi:hypothetical protein